MSTELKTVRLKDVDPNPFRDGSGGNPPATWETVAEAYGFNEDKIKELQDSYAVNGVWAGTHAREVGGRFQLAFGHHRLEAARAMGLKDFPLIVGPYTDDQMLQFMAAENSEEFGHDFALGVMNAVEAVIRAFGAGKIKLQDPSKHRARTDHFREAPSFLVRGADIDLARAYTNYTVGKYLGWTQGAEEHLQAASRVHTAINALELIEQGVLKRSQLKGLGSSSVRELILLTRRAMDAEANKQAQLEHALKERAERAEKEGDKRVLRQVEEKLREVEGVAEKAQVTAAKAAVSTVVEFHKENKKGFAEAARKATEALGLEKQPKPLAKGEKKLDLSGVDNFAALLDRMLLEEEPRWQKIIKLAQVKAAAKTFKELEVSLEQLSIRAGARAQELGKIIRGEEK